MMRHPPRSLGKRNLFLLCFWPKCCRRAKKLVKVEDSEDDDMPYVLNFVGN